MISLSPTLATLHKKLHYNFPSEIPKALPEVPSFSQKLKQYIRHLSLHSYMQFLRMLDIKQADFILEESKQFAPGLKDEDEKPPFPGRSADVWGKALRYELPLKNGHAELVDFIFNLGFTYDILEGKKNHNVLMIYEGDKRSYDHIPLSEINNFFKKHLSPPSKP